MKINKFNGHCSFYVKIQLIIIVLKLIFVVIVTLGACLKTYKEKKI